MNTSSSTSGNSKKGRAKTRIFACLCPCSVFEYVDTDGNLGNIKKKDIGKVGSFNAMDGLDSSQRPTRDTGGKGAFGASRIPPTPGGPSACGQPAQARKPCADAPKPGMQGQRHGPLGRGFQPPGQHPSCPPKLPLPIGDSLLKKPLKIVMEEIDCSKLPQPCPPPKSSCSPPCPPPPCPPPSCNAGPPQPSCNTGCNEHGHQNHHQHQHQQQHQGSKHQCHNQQQGNKCCQPCCEQKQEPPSCPPPCPPPPCPFPQCPEPCNPCGQKHEQPKQDCCPPPPEVKKRFEMKLDKSGKLVNQCTPAGSPTILKVEKDESCPTETIIKITYCAKGTEGGKDGEDEDGKKKDGQDDKDHHHHKKKSSKDGDARKEDKSAKEDKKKGASEGEKTEDESHDEAEHKPARRSKSPRSPTAMMALSSPYGESSCSSLEQMLAIQSTEALLQQLARKPGNFGIRTDEFEAIACPSELGKLCDRPQMSGANNNAKHRANTKSKSRLKVGKVIKPSNYRRSDPISNIVVRETRVVPKTPSKSPVHLLFGSSEAAASAVQMRRRNMRVYCSSSIKREVRPSSTSKRRFKETRV